MSILTDLQRELRTRLQALNRELVTEFSRAAAFKTVPDFRERGKTPLQAILLDHFMKTGGWYSHETNDQLPFVAKLTPLEQVEITITITEFFQEQAPVQAALILETTHRNAVDATRLAEQIEPDPLLIPGVATTAFALALEERVETITILETQYPAEYSKQVEVGVLSSTTIKTWTTMQDKSVKPTHVPAHGQEVLVYEAFTVDGESLSFPGDPSLGATIGNLRDCSCRVVYDLEAIKKERT